MNAKAYTIGSEVLKKDILRKKRKGGKMDAKYMYIGPYVITKHLGKSLKSVTQKSLLRELMVCISRLLTPVTIETHRILTHPLLTNLVVPLTIETHRILIYPLLTNLVVPLTIGLITFQLTLYLQTLYLWISRIIR